MKTQIDPKRMTEIIILLGMCWGFFDALFCHEGDGEIRDKILSLQSKIDAILKDLLQQPIGGE